MYKFINFYNFIENLVIFGGISFVIYQAIVKISKKRTKQICKIAFGVLFAFFIVASWFGLNDKIRYPDISEDFEVYARETIDTVDAFLYNEISLRDAYDIINIYEDNFYPKYKIREVNSTEEAIYKQLKELVFCFEDNCYMYGGDYNTDRIGGVNVYEKDIDSSDTDYIIEYRNQLSELIKLSPYYKDDYEREYKLGYYD